MRKPVKYIETNSTDPYYNLAFEEYVLTYRKEGDYLILWQNDNAVVVGQNQNTEGEINRAFVEEYGIHVVRRITGGGAVYHDLGNLNYSFITDYGDSESVAMGQFTWPVVMALRGLGLEAETSGRNDILVSGRKISGTAQRMVKGRILHHGTLLFDADLGMVERALQVDPQKFLTKSTKSVRARVGNIRDFMPKDMDLSTFWDYLKRELSGEGLEKINLTPEELSEIEKLKAEKYDTWEWNYGRSPQYGLSNKRKWSGGILETKIAVGKGCITDILFYGDFLGVSPLYEVITELRGCRFERSSVAEALGRFQLPLYFGGITLDEILNTMFYTT